MADSTVSSRPGTLTKWDWIKTSFLTAGTALLSTIISMVQTGVAFNWTTFKPVVIASGCAFAMSVISRLSTNSDGKIASEASVSKPDTDKPN